jgi:hypothetical protein
MNLIKLAAIGGLMLAAAPALAQGAPPSETVKLAIEKGTKIDAQGMIYEQTYAPDGTYKGAQEGDAGKWRADGKKLCLTPEALGQELCLEYPDGKKAGDTFEVASDFGPLNVTIKP